MMPGKVDVSIIVEVAPGKVTVDPCWVMVRISVVPGRVRMLPGAVVTKVVPGKVIVEPGSVLMMVEAGIVETLVDMTVNDVTLPEMLVVAVKVCVRVVSLPGTVLMIVLPGRVTVDPG